MAKEPDVVAAEFVRVELTEHQVGLGTDGRAARWSRLATTTVYVTTKSEAADEGGREILEDVAGPQCFALDGQQSGDSDSWP